MAAIDGIAAEEGRSPADVRAAFAHDWSSVIERVRAVRVADDAVQLHQHWQDNYSDTGQTILQLVSILLDFELITKDNYQSVVFLLDYASEHGVIELDCSQHVKHKEKE